MDTVENVAYTDHTKKLSPIALEVKLLNYGINKVIQFFNAWCIFKVGGSQPHCLAGFSTYWPNRRIFNPILEGLAGITITLVITLFCRLYRNYHISPSRRHTHHDTTPSLHSHLPLLLPSPTLPPNFISFHYYQYNNKGIIVKERILF